MTTTQNAEDRPCINRCARRGTETNDEPELLPARHGAYCNRCWGRIDAALKLAPEVVEHVVSLINSKAQPEAKVDGKADQSPLPFNTQAFDDANETYKTLVYWSTVCADLTMQNAPTPAKQAWRARTGRIVGLPANISPGQARYITGVMATWLRIQLDAVLAVALPEFVTELSEALTDVARINARWPQKPRPRYSDMPCPNDDCKGRIAVYPPTEFMDDERIVCEGCHRHFPPEDYQRLIGVFQQVRAEQDPVKRHLLRKYGRTA